MIENCQHSQRGVTLIIIMIFLLILTLLGVNTIQDTSLQEKMAANLRFKDRVFQEAEDVLRIAEAALDHPTLEGFDNSNGHYNEFFDNFSDFDGGASWSVASSWIRVTGGDSTGWDSDSEIQSGYVAQELPILGLEDSKEVGVAKDTRKLYTITARAVSVNTSAQVVLQTRFSR